MCSRVPTCRAPTFYASKKKQRSASKKQEPQHRSRCRHCRRAAGKRFRRGLCWKCYGTPEIRSQYTALPGGFISDPQLSAAAKRKLLRSWKQTTAFPGTPEKVQILEDRVRLRQPLWHPLDNNGGYVEPEDSLIGAALPCVSAMV
jgi:hypothetical protein